MKLFFFYNLTIETHSKAPQVYLLYKPSVTQAYIRYTHTKAGDISLL